VCRFQGKNGGGFGAFTKHRKSTVGQAIERLEARMAIGQSRRAAKEAIRQARGSRWSVSTGKIHSLKTRSVNQEHAIRFIKWARETHHVMSLVQVDPHADELVAEYLQLHISEGKSPYTLQTQRAALRLFFDNRQLAESVPLPRRTGATITRSRGAKAHDRHFQSANWEPLLRFLQATGLRRQELRDLKCRAISRGRDGVLHVHVESGKGGRQREVEVLAEQEGDVLPLSEGERSQRKGVRAHSQTLGCA
jgi:integrase